MPGYWATGYFATGYWATGYWYVYVAGALNVFMTPFRGLWSPL